MNNLDRPMLVADLIKDAWHFQDVSVIRRENYSGTSEDIQEITSNSLITTTVEKLKGNTDFLYCSVYSWGAVKGKLVIVVY